MPSPTTSPANFKTVAIVAKPDGLGVAAPLNMLIALLKARGIKVRLDVRTAEFTTEKADEVMPRNPLDELIEGTDLAIAVGGDGTMLGVARIVARHGVPLVGINLGHLGFLTDISADQAAESLNHLLDGKYDEESRILLEAEILRDNQIIFRSVALNDVVVSRGAMGTMIEFGVEVNGEFVYSARADGLIIATPTGSTAYALSSGGPILQPGLAAISLVPISPHTLSNRPIAISSDSEVRVKLLHGQNARVNFDVQSYFDPATDDVVLVRAHPKPLRLLHPVGYSYFAMLRTKLHWNERTT
ncbi:MAG: NAD kinase [Betaproteobacteria bacterium]